MGIHRQENVQHGAAYTPWKIYGPDLNGVYGGLQGIGGLQLIVDITTGEVVTPLQEGHGHIIMS